MEAPIWPFSHWTKAPTLRLNHGGCLIHSEQCPVLAQSGRILRRFDFKNVRVSVDELADMQQ